MLLKMFRRIVYIVGFISCVVACKEKTEDVQVLNENVVELPEDFVSFYNQFHQDSIYQLDHIVFPLSGKSDSTNWSKNDWIMHKPFDNSSGEFARDLDNFAGIIVETISHDKGMFRMVRRFSKHDEHWNLIYYNVKTIRFED